MKDLVRLLKAWKQSASIVYPHNLGFIATSYERTKAALPFLLACNSHRSANELELIAKDLSPGGLNNAGAFIASVLESDIKTDPRLTAAIIAYNWQGGKFGQQFLPDPAQCPPNNYESLAETLINRIKSGTHNDPLNVLTGNDRTFFQTLPNKMTVYRGCSGISPAQAGCGLSWTRDRRYAEWFARRGGGTCVLVSARISKSEIGLAFNSEGGEIVVKPEKVRVLKCRFRRSRPS